MHLSRLRATFDITSGSSQPYLPKYAVQAGCQDRRAVSVARCLCCAQLAYSLGLLPIATTLHLFVLLSVSIATLEGQLKEQVGNQEAQ